MARLFDDLHDPLMRDLCGTAVSEPASMARLSEAVARVDIDHDIDSLLALRAAAIEVLIEHETVAAIEQAAERADQERMQRRRERMLAHKIDLAIERGDLAAIAILEGPIFGYADRFMREG
jgi:hypothetical protein